MAKKKRRQKGRKSALGWVIALLIAALAIVAAVIVWKQAQYGASADYYDGLRNIGLLVGGKIA